MVDKKHPISQALGIANDESEQDNVISLSLPANNEAEVDFKTARDNTHELLDDAMGAVKELLQIAAYSQDHESYQSLALLMKTAAQLNRDLVGLAFKKEVLTQGSTSVSGPTTINSNNTLVCTSSQLQEMLEKKD
jgi:hypothetical protein